jgi:hypothetical protein
VYKESVRHQNLAGNFFSQLKQKLANKTCKPCIAPANVVLSAYVMSSLVLLLKSFHPLLLYEIFEVKKVVM